MARSLIAIQVNRLHLAFLNRIDDTHIFAQQSIPLLETYQGELTDSNSKEHHRYIVPKVKSRGGIPQKRSDRDLKEIYDRFIRRELYENFIVTAVSQFESYLFEVLRIVITVYPQKLALNIKGTESKRDIPLEFLLNAKSLSEVITQIVDRRLNELSYASPKEYLEYLGKIIGIDNTDPAFLDYIEIKATRDLVIHNSGIINQIYLSKVGDKKRGVTGQSIMIDAGYFDHCMATLKRLSGIIQRDITESFTKNSHS
ncbi:MAG: hypothetical protein M1281_04155 [Chloroflexi bacterium]|nr:hypothetical protein [Chloroflexota bacterium]